MSRFWKKSCPDKQLSLGLAFAFLFATTSGAMAAPGDAELAKQCREFIRQGMVDYKKGDYQNAAGHLGAALASDFNNPLLHYYLGSSYAQLKQTDGAIREFRIAYALQPEGEVGEYTRKALAALGVDATNNEIKKLPQNFQKAASSLSSPPLIDWKSEKNTYTPPPVEQTKSTLQRQAELEKSARTGLGQSTSETQAKRDAEALKRAKDEALDNSPHNYSRRYGTPYPVRLSTDSLKQLDSIKQDQETHRKMAAESAAQQAKEIEKSASNLQDLLNDRPKAGEAKLVPGGTNLFIRNYEPVTPSGPSTVKSSSSAAPQHACASPNGPNASNTSSSPTAVTPSDSTVVPPLPAH